MAAVFQKRIMSFGLRAILTVIAVTAMVAMPPAPLTAHEVNFNGQRVLANNTSINAKANFVPAAHVMVEHGTITSIENISPAGGDATTPHAHGRGQDIFVSVIGGSRNDTIVVSCDVESEGLSESCKDIDIDGPQQVVKPGQTMHSNITVQPTAAAHVRKNDMTVVISFSYI